jgi:hypothetical protein
MISRHVVVMSVAVLVACAPGGGEELDPADRLGQAQSALTLVRETSLGPFALPNVQVRAVAADDEGNVYAAGRSVPALPWALTPIHIAPAPPSPLVQGAFVVSFDASGAFRWGVKYQSANYNEIITSIAVREGEVAVGGCTGCYWGPAVASAIVAKLDADTGAPIFTRVFSGSSSVTVDAVDLSENGSLFVTGGKSRTLVMDAVSLPSRKTRVPYVAKLNLAGTAQWARDFKSSSADAFEQPHFYGIRATTNDYVAVTGYKHPSTSLAIFPTSTKGSLPTLHTFVLLMLRHDGVTSWGVSEAGWRGYDIDIDAAERFHVTGFGTGGSRYARYDLNGDRECFNATPLPGLAYSVTSAGSTPMLLTSFGVYPFDGYLHRADETCATTHVETIPEMLPMDWWDLDNGYRLLATDSLGRTVVGGSHYEEDEDYHILTSPFVRLYE